MEQDDLQDLVNGYVEAYNAFDLERMYGFLSPDIHFENHSGGTLTAQTRGLDEFRKLAEQSKALFAEREQRIRDWEIGENGIVVQIDYRGRLAQDIPGGPPAGTVIDLQGVSEFTFKEGKIATIIDRS